MTTLSQYLDAITAADTRINALNRGPGPVLDLLPALVVRSRLQDQALHLALDQLRDRGGADADERDLLALHGRLNTLAAMVQI